MQTKIKLELSHSASNLNTQTRTNQINKVVVQSDEDSKDARSNDEVNEDFEAKKAWAVRKKAVL